VNTVAAGKTNYGSKYLKGISIKYDPWEVTTLLAMANENILNNANGHSGRATTLSINNATAQSYLADLQTIAKNNKSSNVNVYNPNATSILSAYGNLFDVANSLSGITFDTTAALGTIQDYLSLYPAVTLGVAPLPTLTGKVTGGAPSGGNGLFINSSNSSALQQAASWTFINYVTQPAAHATWDAATGYLPIRTDEVSTWESKLNATQKAWYLVGYNELNSSSSTASQGMLLGNYDQVNGDIGTALESLLTSPFTTTPAQALTSAQNNANSDIASYNSSLG
jgi:sn-glycerol 3-phosphate transport system substrate-binding protein